MRTPPLLILLALLAAPSLTHADDAPDGDAPDADAPDADPAAAAADATAADAPVLDAAVMAHVPPGEAAAGRLVELIAVVDAAWREPEIVAHWRPLGSGGPWQDAVLERSSAGGWYAALPAGATGVEYWIAGLAAGRQVAHFASADAPHPVPVVPTLLDQLATTDRARQLGRDDLVAFDVEGQDFGNRFDTPADRRRDQYLRAEVRLTHHFYGAIYATTFGFGAIAGVTPSGPEPSATELRPRARYGFGEVRTRLLPAVFVDLRGTLGVSQDGFIVGGAAAVTLGRPWATSVTIGGENLQGLGPSGYVRLQWDTAPPLLMGASVIRTDLPGAQLDDGVMLRYDVAYTVAAQWMLRGALSAGARDGHAHVGGGLGMGYQF